MDARVEVTEGRPTAEPTRYERASQPRDYVHARTEGEGAVSQTDGESFALDEDKPGGSGGRRYAPAIATAVVALAFIGAGYWYFRSSDSLPPPKPALHEFTIVQIKPPPPPPPPPPQKMIEQSPVKEQEFQEQKPVEEAKEKPKDEPKPIQESKADEPPPGPLSLDAKATGPGDLFGLGGKPGGHGLIGGGGGGSTRWGWYAALVQTEIETALRTNEHTRSAVMQMRVRLWADTSGRVNRVQIVSSSGSAEIDSAVQHQVLPGMTFREPPPKDMPMPILMRITTRRPS